MKKTLLLLGFAISLNSFSQQISGGGQHSLSICSDGSLFTWGDNASGQLGNGNNSPSYTPVSIASMSNLLDISGSRLHTLAVKNDNTLWAWGSNSDGQLGNGSTTNSNIPVQISSLTGVIKVAAAYGHSLALKSDGTVWAWGSGAAGQLGNGANSNSNTPIQITALSGIIDLGAGDSHSLALKNDGTVWAWGWNAYGQLGNGSNTDSNIPVQVTSLTNIIAIGGGNGHSIALKSDGTVWAWGINTFGELGNGSNTGSNIPVQVSTITNITKISCGRNHSLALKNDGTVWAWGIGSYGILGNGSGLDSNIPVQSTITNVVEISAGYNHSMAIKNDGKVWSWGNSTQGQMGTGSNAFANPTPIETNTHCINCTVTIPDANFKNYLVNNPQINTNSDSEIQCSEAAAFNGTLQCNGLSISDMTGIEAFTSLTALHCCCNQITSLDVSMLSNLSAVWCSVNQLTSLNVANGNNTNFNMYYFDTNPNLTCVEVDDAAYSTTNWTNIDPTASYSEDCSAANCTVTIPDANFKNYLVNNLQINTNADSEIQCNEAIACTEAISVSNLMIADLTGIEAFINITQLFCHVNLLTSIDVSSLTLLEELICHSNSGISSLDVSANPDLLQLNCTNLNLTQLNISNNPNLYTLGCGGNQLSSLDVSNNMALEYLICNYNQLTSLNVKNGNNINFSYFAADNNPNLVCIEVDDAAFSTTNWTNVDATASFSEDCATFLTVSENVQSPIISLFPNPTSSEINVTTGKFGEIVILAVTGQEIMKCTIYGSKKLDISNLESGVYFIKDIHSSAIYKFVKE